MKKFLFYSILCALFSITALQAQGNYGINFSGFVKSDNMFDSRQTVAAREGHFVLYPAAEDLDENNDDINAQPHFNMLAIQTRLTGKISAPDAFGAKVSGVIEGAFFGHTNDDINGFRLRHAMMQMTWDKSTLTFGQTWHPLFVTACFPGVVSFNTGVPLQPFSRNPQIRLTQSLNNKTKLILAAMSQRDFASTGGSTSLRNAVIPNLHAQLQLSNNGNVFGAGVDYKILRPVLAVDETVAGMSFLAYTKLDVSGTTVKVYGIVGQNLTDHLMLGGYAFKATAAEYTTVNNMSVWGELIRGKKRQVGLFAGYTKNQGASDPVISSTVSARGSNIDNVLRVSPRIVWNSGKARFALEGEYTAAAYGTADNELKVEDTTTVSNFRVLFATYLFF
ncbi:MAG: hypothetical protein DWQ05_01945 [Calditrichaeota bacterium]|nr:MAG: hypothetical protein DWQ05_01945 [Calditrichota bacterium]